MDAREVYKQLTSVDINKQMQIWDERGKGYYGEYLLFCELYKSVPGCAKILMNLNLPVSESSSTEVDLILIHETGLYVFEIKHFKGTIYGKDTDPIWTQYFRTVKNNTFKNPVLQNSYHIDALKKLFPEIPIHSCIVFTNSDCDIRVKQSNTNISICRLIDIPQVLGHRFKSNENLYTMETIDTIFQKLSAFSQMKAPVIIDEKEQDFFAWVEPAIRKLEEGKAELENEKNLLKSTSAKLKKARVVGIVSNILIAILCIALSFFISFGIIKNAKDEFDTELNESKAAFQTELNQFKQNFLHVDEIDNDSIRQLNSFVDVSNVRLSPVADSIVSFSARISVTTDVYGIALTENSKYIVMTSSGKVYEYNVFGDHLKYNQYNNRLGKGIRSYGDLNPAQFFLNANDITYIKLTGIDVFKLNAINTVVKSNLEIELYSK
ncbi:MAG: NERD domain-containing protein [Clostridia bacterium]|nr:NERD domain-containing protein [Clostridia bacterium]